MKVTFDVIEGSSFAYSLFFIEFVDYLFISLRYIGSSTISEHVHQLPIFILLWLVHEQLFNSFWIACGMLSRNFSCASINNFYFACTRFNLF